MSSHPLRAVCCCVLFISGSALSEIRFQEVTASAGISYSGQTFGASWGDHDGDGLPDLWVNNHLLQPVLYRNNGDGTFSDILPSIWSGNPDSDTHGAAWCDFDNDGDQDLFQIIGGQQGVGEEANQLFDNRGGILVDIALSSGVDYPLGRGRTPQWLDWNNDGLVDVLLTNTRRPDKQAPSALFEQTMTGFSDISDTVGFDVVKSANYAQLSDLTSDGVLDLFIHGWRTPYKIYDTTQVPFIDLNPVLFQQEAILGVQDSIIADLNGDLLTDIFLTRDLPSSTASDVFKIDNTRINLKLFVATGEKGIRFKSSGDVLFDIRQTNKSENYSIFFGEFGQNPQPPRSFMLSANDPSVWGNKVHTAGVDKGIYIGYEPDTQIWTLLLSTPENKHGLNAIIETVATISELAGIGFDPDIAPPADYLLVQTPSGLIDQSNASGLGMPSACNAVTAGDFDNDMDIDLYLACNRPAANIPNILYENLGNGSFSAVTDAGGASGSSQGRGENTVTADYDLDGFLDLFVTNGADTNPFNNGPHQLFRNQGNENHWIEIDLQGVESNRDGIGARVFASTGDGVTQLREQNGGIHKFAQNHARLHFGLGTNERIDELQVEWPSGIRQSIYDLAADHVLQVIERVSPNLAGKPAYQGGVDDGFYLWKRRSGVYKIRISGDGDFSSWIVRVISTDQLIDVVPRGLNDDDSLVLTPYGLNLKAQVSIGVDGIEFRTLPGSKTLIAVEKDGYANPRQVHIGSSGLPLSPVGWIVPVSQLVKRSEFDPAASLGMYLGHGNQSEQIEAHWTGTEIWRRASVQLLSSHDTLGNSIFQLESDDIVQSGSNWISVDGVIADEVDGLVIDVGENSYLGVIYQQDSIDAPNRVYSSGSELGQPNAYWLP